MIRQIARIRPATLLHGLALLGTIACKQEEPNVAAKDYPKQVAFSYCEAVYSCSCESYPYDDLNECFADLSAAYDELSDAAYLAGLSYDGSCPAKEVEQIETLACKTWLPEPSSNVCVPPCHAWHGSLSAGAQCSVAASSAELGISFSSCAQGLDCISGVCVNPCQLAGLPKLGEPCPDLVCDAGLVCDQDQICVAQAELPGPGEACLDGLCDPNRAVCIADGSVCAQLPALGQQCVQGQCEKGAYCGTDNVCLASPALACGLLGGAGPGDGDGDGDPTTGDGDGDPTTGDGDGDPTTGCTPGTLGCVCDGGACAEGLGCDEEYVCSEKICGDGVATHDEECDSNDLQGADCQSLGFDWGELACDPQTCELDTSACGNGSVCGNGVVEPGEQCDGSDLNGLSCQDLGFGSGSLSCDEYCLFDVSFCFA